MKPQADDESPKRALKTFCAADWEGVQVPTRKWLVDGVIPFENVTLLSGDGGLGKSILALMLGAALSTRTNWLGLETMQGPSLYFGAEDDMGELHRRLDQIRCELGVSWGDLADFHLASLAGEDALLGVFDKASQKINSTELCEGLEKRIEAIGAVSCIIDTSAEVFGGDEISRQQVRQFVGLLRRISIRNHLSTVLLSHPSLSGMASGSGTSGSTGWHNSVRSRVYLKGDERDPDARTLQFMKANYGPKAKPMRLRWQNGLFVPIAVDENTLAINQAIAEATFLSALDAYTAQNRRVSSKPSSGYAPTVFAADKAVLNGLTKDSSPLR